MTLYEIRAKLLCAKKESIYSLVEFIDCEKILPNVTGFRGRGIGSKLSQLIWE